MPARPDYSTTMAKLKELTNDLPGAMRSTIENMILKNAVDLVSPLDRLLLSNFSCLSWPLIWYPENRSCGPAARRTKRRHGTRISWGTIDHDCHKSMLAEKSSIILRKPKSGQ